MDQWDGGWNHCLQALGCWGTRKIEYRYKLYNYSVFCTVRVQRRPHGVLYGTSACVCVCTKATTTLWQVLRLAPQIGSNKLIGLIPLLSSCSSIQSKEPLFWIIVLSPFVAESNQRVTPWTTLPIQSCRLPAWRLPFGSRPGTKS